MRQSATFALVYILVSLFLSVRLAHKLELCLLFACPRQLADQSDLIWRPLGEGRRIGWLPGCAGWLPVRALRLR